MEDLVRGRAKLSRHRARVVAIPLIAAAVLLAACGSSGGGSGTGKTTGLKGSTVKIMTIASVNTSGVSFPIFFRLAKIFQSWANDNGGINGHPVQVITCDDQGLPAKGADCARQAVSEKVVAVVGGFTFQGDQIVPILAAGHVSWFGDIVPITQSEYTKPNVQILGAGLADYVANGVAPGVDGCKKTTLFTYQDNGKNVTKLTNLGLKSVGAPKLTRSVYIPSNVQDYAPQVEQATNGSDCIVVTVGQVTIPPFLTAFKAAGGKQRLYVQAGNVFNNMLTNFVPQTQNMNIAGSYGSITSPAWADFRAALTKYHASGNVPDDYNGSAGLGAWASYLAFKQVAEKISGDLTPAAFLSAAQKAKISLPGKIGDVDFSKKLTEDPLHLNSVNNKVSFEVVRNGKVTPLNPGKFYDMTPALLGKSLTGANRPPAETPALP